MCPDFEPVRELVDDLKCAAALAVGFSAKPERDLVAFASDQRETLCKALAVLEDAAEHTRFLIVLIETGQTKVAAALAATGPRVA